MNRQTLVIGVGNAYRGDDAAGLEVARLLQAMVHPNLTCCEQSGEGTALMQAWQGAERVIVIDAISSNTTPGAVCRFQASAQSVPSIFFSCSTHAFSVAEAIELARALHELPPHLVAYGIAGENFVAGIGLSKPVRQGVKQVVEKILREVQAGDA